MRAVRFGSYSIAATLAGIPTLSRRKSILPVEPLVSAAPVPRRDVAHAAAAARARADAFDQRPLGALLREIGEVRHAHLAPARRRRLVYRAQASSDSLEELDRLALGQPHDRLLPLRPLPDELADAPRLARHAAWCARRTPAPRTAPRPRGARRACWRAGRPRTTTSLRSSRAERALLGHERLHDHVVDLHAAPSARAFVGEPRMQRVDRGRASAAGACGAARRRC